MSKYVFKTTAFAEEFFDEIVNEMKKTFGISHEEAVGRVNKRWSHINHVGDESQIFHMLPEEWAYDVYYGPSSRWWKGTEGLTPLPYHEDDHDKQ